MYPIFLSLFIKQSCFSHSKDIMGIAFSAAAAIITVDSVEEGFYADRVDVVDLRIENTNDHDLHLDTIKMSYHTIARHDRYINNF